MNKASIVGIAAAAALTTSGLAAQGSTGKLLLAVGAVSGAGSAVAALLRESKTRKRFAGVLDIEDEIHRSTQNLKAVENQLRKATGSLNSKENAIERLRTERSEITDEVATMRADLISMRKVIDVENDLQIAGFAARRYLGIDSDTLLVRLKDNRTRQKEVGKSILDECQYLNFTYNDSTVQGRAFAKRTVTSWLRGFNAECDAAISTLKHSNDSTVLNKIDKAFNFYEKKAAQQSFPWASDIAGLKEEEAFLVHEHHLEKQREKEEQAEIRREMREEERALREAEEAQKKAEREAEKYEELLRKAREEAYSDSEEAEHLSKIAELERRLAEAEANRERAISRAQMTRSGHVYVISNVGSFGQDVFKVGMSRRLDPMERVKELGDASVPFPFDVHAMIFTEDAPGFEKEIHRQIWEHRVNRVNDRREFFQLSMPQLEEATARAAEKLNIKAEIRWTRYALAEQYRQSVSEGIAV